MFLGKILFIRNATHISRGLFPKWCAAGVRFDIIYCLAQFTHRLLDLVFSFDWQHYYYYVWYILRVNHIWTIAHWWVTDDDDAVFRCPRRVRDNALGKHTLCIYNPHNCYTKKEMCQSRWIFSHFILINSTPHRTGTTVRNRLFFAPENSLLYCRILRVQTTIW